MAVERRVKPSAKLKAELSRKRKPILIAIGSILVLALIVVGAVTVFSHDFFKSPGGKDDGKNKVDDMEAVRAMLATTVSYSGHWVDVGLGNLAVYLPGDVQKDTEELNSKVIYTNEGGSTAFGILVGDVQLPTLDGDPAKDANAILDTLFRKLTDDVGVTLYGAKYSGSYDVTSYTLGDRYPGLWVSGDLQTVMGLQGDGEAEVSQVTYNFPFNAVVTMREDYPVIVWGVADPDDGSASANLSTWMKECAAIFSGNSNLDK